MPSRAVGAARLLAEADGRPASAAPSAPPASPAAGWIQMSLEAAVAQQLAVGDAVERHAAGQAEIASRRSRAASARVSRSTTSSVTAWIDAARSICALRQRLLRLARRAAEQRVEALVGHGQAGAVVEVVACSSRNEPSGFTSISCSRISLAYLGSP